MERCTPSCLTSVRTPCSAVPAAHPVLHSAQHEQSIDDGEGFQNEASIQAAAAAMAAALQGGGSDSRDSTQSPHAKRRRGGNGQTAAAAAAAAAAALGSADSDYEVSQCTSHLCLLWIRLLACSTTCGCLAVDTPG